MNTLSVAVLVCLVGISHGAITKDTVPTLTVCKMYEAGELVQFKCDAGEAVATDAEMVLKKKANKTYADFAHKVKELRGDSVTRLVQVGDVTNKDTFKCVVEQTVSGSKATTKESAEVTIADKTKLAVCGKSSAPHVVNSFALAVVCLLVTAFKSS